MLIVIKFKQPEPILSRKFQRRSQYHAREHSISEIHLYFAFSRNRKLTYHPLVFSLTLQLFVSLTRKLFHYYVSQKEYNNVKTIHTLHRRRRKYKNISRKARGESARERKSFEAAPTKLNYYYIIFLLSLIRKLLCCLLALSSDLGPYP